MTEAPDKIWVHYERKTDDAVWSEYPYNDGVEDFTHYGEYTRSDIAQAAEASMHNAFYDTRKARTEVDTLRAEVARLREALVLITGEYDPSDYGGISEAMFTIAGDALQSHREAD